MCMHRNNTNMLVLSAVIIMCMPSVLIGGQAQYQLLTTALAMRMIDRGYVFIPYDTLLYSLPYKDAFYYMLGNDTKLRRAFDGVLTITMESGERNFYEAFKDAQDRFELRSSTPAEQVRLLSKYCECKIMKWNNYLRDKQTKKHKHVFSNNKISNLLGFSFLWYHL